MLEEKCNTRDEMLTQVQKTVTYLKDERRPNNICIVGVMENSEKGDMDGFVFTLLKEGLGLDID